MFNLVFHHFFLINRNKTFLTRRSLPLFSGINFMIDQAATS